MIKGSWKRINHRLEMAFIQSPQPKAKYKNKNGRLVYYLYALKVNDQKEVNPKFRLQMLVENSGSPLLRLAKHIEDPSTSRKSDKLFAVRSRN